MRKMILFLSFFPAFCFGQEMKNITQLEAEKTAIDAKLSVIAESPVKFANDKIASLDEWIKKLPDRQPTKAENITMKQHLSNIKAEIERNPGDYVTKEIEKLLIQKARIEAQITNIQKEVIDENLIKEK